MELKQFCKENNIPLEKLGDIGEVSDGFHTFNSLYHQRLILFATLANAFPNLAWKSHKHSDGEDPFGGGWFVVGISTPKGQYTYHYEDKDWDIFHCRELEKAPEWDGHTDADVERLLSLTSESEEDTSSWAAHEVNLAIQAEKEASEGTDDWNYGAECYKSAYRAFRSLTSDGHSNFSIQITKGILNRLIDGQCLTPIEDTPDIWNEVPGNGGAKTYQCKRMSSLFKDVAKDGSVTYSDVDRVQVVDIDKPGVAYHNSFTTRLVDKIFPITMPYLPSSKKFKVVRNEFLVDPQNGDYDTVAYLYIETPEGKIIDLNRFFKEENGEMIQIDKAEFDERKSRKVEKK